MPRINGTALTSLAAVLASALFFVSYSAAPAQESRPSGNTAAQPPKAPTMRIQRAPDSEQRPLPAAASGPAASQPGPASQPGVTVVTTQLSPAAAAFERIKSLAGKWQLENPPMATVDGITDFSTTFRVVSGGNTVEETDFPGSRRENITVYHRDGDALMLTHYCPLGSQPRMRATRFDEPDRISFIFHDGTNLDPGKDRHCHNVMFTFTDADHFQQDWTFYADGQQHNIKSFVWKRVKE